MIGHDQVGNAVAVQVGDGDADGIGSDRESLRGAVLAAAEAGIDEDVIGAAVGDDEVGDAVAIEVGQHHGGRGKDTLGEVGQDLRSGTAGLDRDLVEAVIGEGEDVLPCVSEVGHRQGHLLIDFVIGHKAPVAVPQQHEHVAIGVADEQVGHAVAVDVGDGQPRRVRAGVVGLSAGRTRPGRWRGRRSPRRSRGPPGR